MSGENIAAARAEILQRLGQRDALLTVYGTTFTAFLGFAIGRSGYDILLAVPVLSLALSLLVAYHDGNIEFLHRYVARVASGDAWDACSEREQYAKSGFKWTLVCAQSLVFVGTSAAALAANYKVLLEPGNFLLALWGIDAAITLALLYIFVRMRVWRHTKTA